MKLISTIITTIILLYISSITHTLHATQTDTTAQIINSEISIEHNELTDLNPNTSYTFDSNQEIIISSDEPIKYVYVIFEEVPKSWELRLNLGSYYNGRYGILHELVTINIPSTQFSMFFQTDTTISDIYFYSDGQLPDTVQKWEPPVYDTDIMVFPSSIGNEHLIFGAVITSFTNSHNLQLAYSNNYDDDTQQISSLLDGLWELGVTTYPIFPTIEDVSSENSLLEYKINLLRRYKPEVVVGNNIDDSSIDYADTVQLVNAFNLSNDENFVSSVEPFAPSKLYLHLYDKNNISIDINATLQDYDNKTIAEIILNGLSKLTPFSNLSNINALQQYQPDKFGLYSSVVGYHNTNDLFYNITEFSHLVQKPIIPPEEETSSDEDKDIQIDDVQPLITTDTTDIPSVVRSCLVIAGALITIYSMRRISDYQKKINAQRTDALNEVRAHLNSRRRRK